MQRGEHANDNIICILKKFGMNLEWRAWKNKHNLYLKANVLLLIDVLSQQRKICLKHYRLDPGPYFSSPGLSWGAMLKITGVILNLITDFDIYQFIEVI